MLDDAMMLIAGCVQHTRHEEDIAAVLSAVQGGCQRMKGRFGMTAAKQVVVDLQQVRAALCQTVGRLHHRAFLRCLACRDCEAESKPRKYGEEHEKQGDNAVLPYACCTNHTDAPPHSIQHHLLHPRAAL